MPKPIAVIMPTFPIRCKWEKCSLLNIFPSEVLLSELKNVDYVIVILEHPENYEISLQLEPKNLKQQLIKIPIIKNKKVLASSIHEIKNCFEKHSIFVHLFQGAEKTKEDCEKEVFLKICDFLDQRKDFCVNQN